MNKLDKFYLVYFLLHIPITVLIDSNIVVPDEHRLAISKSILEFHISTNNDILLINNPLWFKLFGLVELVFQLPLFFYCSLLLYKQVSKSYYVYMIIYGFNASFTTFVCLGYIYFEGIASNMSNFEIYNLLAIYSPYLFIPLVMLVDYSKRTIKLLNEKVKTN